MRALCRQLATVVTVTGDISDANVDHISACAKRFVLTEKPFVLDRTGVDSFSTECISLLYAVDEDPRSRRSRVVGHRQPTGPPDTALVRRARDVPHCGFRRRGAAPLRRPDRRTPPSLSYLPRPPNRKGAQVLIDLRWLSYLLHGRALPRTHRFALVRRVVAWRADTARTRCRTVSGIDNSGGGARSAHRPSKTHRAGLHGRLAHRARRR